jgi:hypothetical protein
LSKTKLQPFVTNTQHIDLWEIADDVWAWNEATAFIAARALRWSGNLSNRAKQASEKKQGKSR